MKVLRMMGLFFCGLVTLAGIINVISPSAGDSRFENIILTLIFGYLTIALLRKKKPHSGKTRDKVQPHTSKPVPTAPPAEDHAHTAETFPVVFQDQHSASTVDAVADSQIRVSDNTNVSLMPFQETFRRIPQEIIDLLWFMNGPLKNYTAGWNTWSIDLGGASISFQSIMMEEPSAIDMGLPTCDHLVSCPPLDYYPSYGVLTPEQRTVYLNWLTDITAPIDIGYVFIFYYGLERHLFFGKKEKALAAILILREFHANGSFLAYSGDALMLYALLNDRPDIVQHIETEQSSTDLQLFSAALLRHSLAATEIMVAHRKFSFENNRYIKGQPELFQSTLEKFLTNQYGSNAFPITLEDLQAAKGTFTLALANYSLLPEQRFLTLPDISSSAKVHSAINALLTETHETVKIKLREARKKETKQ